jgi:hypothetical protein
MASPLLTLWRSPIFEKKWTKTPKGCHTLRKIDRAEKKNSQEILDEHYKNTLENHCGTKKFLGKTQK